MMSENQASLKSILLQIVNNLKERGVDLSKTPALYTWSYEEEPFIEFKLLVNGVAQARLPLVSTEVM